MAPNTSKKYDLEKFDASNDFSLWRMKMRVVLIQQGLLKSLKGKQGLPDTMSANEKEDVLEGAHSALLLCLADNVLRKKGQYVHGGGETVINSQELRKKVSKNRGEEYDDGLMARGRSTDHAGSRNKGRSRSQSKARKLKCNHCGVMRIMKGALVVMKGLKQNSLYLLQGSTVSGAAASTSSSVIDFDTTKLWHMPLGPMSESGMDVLSKKGFLGSKKIGKLDFCEHCVFEKQFRVKFSWAVHTTKEEELIDAGKDHGAMEKVELEVRTLVSLTKIPADEEYGSHFTEENEEPQEHQYNIARNRSRREI
ncbi:hypothetical protein RJ640_017487 [Escallonia rubra]|uniref:GAG-pre-integrase domain-containing protein n=1 Tax=Escallonia rubra TaxID=112253 RepID=A0AA88UEF7_9ASTE|nr:hypothetical protein RJ640_017487 [Escallonia rubra]